MLRKKVTIGAAVAASVALFLAGCANQPSTGGSSNGNSSKVDIPAITSVDVPKDAVLPAGDGKATCPAGLTIGYVGAETGPNAQLGIQRRT